MPRRRRSGQGGLLFHVFNRSARRSVLFLTSADYAQLEKVLVEACAIVPMRILAYCVMPNHWHLLLWPRQDGDLSTFMRWATATHAMRWRMSRDTVGEGALYQGRYRAVPVQGDRHLLTVARYIEHNPVRAHLADVAEDWPWSSAAAWRRPDRRPPLSEWPLPRPFDWSERLRTESSDESVTAAVRASLRDGTPFGDDTWRETIERQLARQSQRRARGRPPGRTGGKK